MVYSIIKNNTQGPFHYQFMNQKYNFDQITFISCSKISGHIELVFCTCHDSLAVMACAKFWLRWIIKIWVKGKYYLISSGLWIDWSLGTWLHDPGVWPWYYLIHNEGNSVLWEWISAIADYAYNLNEELILHLIFCPTTETYWKQHTHTHTLRSGLGGVSDLSRIWD